MRASEDHEEFNIAGPDAAGAKPVLPLASDDAPSKAIPARNSRRDVWDMGRKLIWDYVEVKP